jgi:hypothetical protein
LPYIRSGSLAPLTVSALALAALSACETPAQQQAEESASIEKQAAKEMARICALPNEQREAELKKIREKSGLVLYCGGK